MANPSSAVIVAPDLNDNVTLIDGGFRIGPVQYLLATSTPSGMTFVWQATRPFTVTGGVAFPVLDISGFTDLGVTGSFTSGTLDITGSIEDLSGNALPSLPSVNTSVDLTVASSQFVNWDVRLPVPLTAGAYLLSLGSEVVATPSSGQISVQVDPGGSQYDVRFLPEPPAAALLALGGVAGAGYAGLRRRLKGAG
jgi:hypothetical protein